MPALVAFGKRRIGLEIGACQIVKQHFEAGVEQIAPAADQMLEQGWLVRQKSVVTAIERADLRQALVRAQKVGQRALVEPLPMQPPFAARRQKAIGDKHEQNLIPRRALAARGQLLIPEAIQLQLAPQRQGQPTRAKRPWTQQSQLLQLQTDDRAVVGDPLAPVIGKQRQGPRLRRPLLKGLDRFAPRKLLAIVDLAQIQNVALNHAAPADAPVLHHAEVAVLLAVLLANRRAQKHDGAQLSILRVP